MNRQISIVSLIMLTLLNANCQDLDKFSSVVDLPKSLKEVSGIEVQSNTNLIYCINDSGNEPAVYLVNSKTGKIERIIKVINAKNHDWEDLTTDHEGSLYIGDFGNNSNKRKNLKILKLSKASLGSDRASAEVISFRFEDQKEFPPKRKHRNFDVEAFIFWKENLYLFTRNRSSKFDGTSKIYQVPATSGEHIAKLVGSFISCKDRSDCQITSAAINSSENKIALLSYNKVWLLSEFSGSGFKEAKVQLIKLKHKSQKESITFFNDSTLFIADEKSGGSGRNLYTLSLKE